MHALRFVAPKLLIPFRAIRVLKPSVTPWKSQSVRTISNSAKKVTIKTLAKPSLVQRPRNLFSLQLLRKINKDFARQFFSVSSAMAAKNITFPFDVAEEKLVDDVLLKNFTTGRSSYEAANLVTEVPEGKPTFPLKKLVYDLAIKGREFKGALKASRYKLFPVEKVVITSIFIDFTAIFNTQL